MDLLQTLISTMGISEAQAKSGLGALFALAKTKISAQTYSEICKLIPQLDNFIQHAPPAAGALGALGGLLGGGKLAELAKLAGQFQSIGMPQNQLATFAQTAFDFLVQHLSGSAKDELVHLAQSLKK